MSLVKRYWAEILVFLTIGAVLICDLSPGITWINTDSDGAHYILAAKYMTTAHNTSAPLFLLIGRLFLWIPLGSDAWRMGLISVVGTMIAVSFIYLIVKKLLVDNKNARWLAIIASIIYGGSALVISQSTIIETYALTTGLLLGVYYFILNKRWNVASVFLGVCLAIHPLLTGLMWLVFFCSHKELRKWKPFIIMASFILFYLYIPIAGLVNPNGNMWNNTSIEGFFRGNFGTLFMLSGGISMWDLPKRIIDTFSILGISLGFGLLLNIWQFLKVHKLRYELMWLVIAPTLYFVTNLSAETYVYLIVAVAFASIVSALVLSKIKWQFAITTLLIALGLMGYNVNYLDIGRTCFPKGTKILIKRRWKNCKLKPDNTTDSQSIENIKIGDEVLSFNVKTGKKEYKPVVKLYRHKTNDFIMIKFANGNEIRCTPEHPIAVDDYGRIKWVQAKDLNIDDKCIQHYYGWFKQRVRNISIRGKTIEDRYGKSKAKELRMMWSDKHSKLRDDKSSIYNSKDYANNMRVIVNEGYELGTRKSWNMGLTKETDNRVKNISLSISQAYKNNPKIIETIRKKQKDNWKNPNSKFHTEEYWDLYRKGRNNKPSGLEVKVKQILDSAFPSTWIYTGNYTYPIKDSNSGKRRFPDFKHYCYKKLIEAFNNFDKIRKYGTVKRYKQITTRFYHKAGYEVKYLEYYNVFRNPDKIVKLINDYIYNPNVYITKVISKEYVRSVNNKDVYNIEVKDNNNYYAFGILVHNCDPEMSAMKFYNEELPKIPDGQIYMAGGWTWAMSYLYNREENRNIIPICTDDLPSSQYLDMIEKQGIKLTRNDSSSYITKEGSIAVSIAEQNDNVWIAKVTKPEVYQYEIVPAKDNIDYIGRWIGQEITPAWKFKPSNPYKYITGQLEVSEWHHILMSNKNAVFISFFGLLGYTVFWIFTGGFRKRKKNENRLKKEKAKTS